jgi:hypothetical protein
MTEFLRPPPDGGPWPLEFLAWVREELNRKEPLILGVRHDGTTIHLRFRAALTTPWVQVHVQTTEAGQGGSAYDASNFLSSTEVDCHENRVQDVEVTDLPYGRSFVWLVPVQYDGAGTKILYNGVGDSPNHMSYWDVGV